MSRFSALLKADDASCFIVRWWSKLVETLEFFFLEESLPVRVEGPGTLGLVFLVLDLEALNPSLRL
jgi:hypothetical protein